MKEVTKIVAVLNNLETADAVLSKASAFSKEQDAGLEVVYVHEEAFFQLPDFFRFKESPAEETVDEEKIKKEIALKLAGLGVKESCPILVFTDDTADRILLQTKNEKETVIVISYHEKIARKLIKKSHLPVLVIKNNTADNYKKVLVPIDFSPASRESAALAKALFANSNIELLHDFRYLFNTGYADPEGMGTLYMDMENIDIEKEANKKEFEAFTKKMQLKGSFITEESSLEEDLLCFIQQNGFDLAVLGSHDTDTLFFGSVSFDLLEKSPIDLLIYAPQTL